MDMDGHAEKKARSFLAAAEKSVQGQRRSGKAESDASPPGPDPSLKDSEKEVTPGKKKIPFKEFVPSEPIEPDHAVDFPVDI